MNTFKNNSVCNLFKIKYPVISGGMVWASGARLVVAVSNSGGLGLLGAGSMTPEFLEQQIHKTAKHTDNPFGVNIPLAGKYAADHIDVCIKNSVKIVFTAAGSPAKFIEPLKAAGITVAHVVPSAKLAKKVEDYDCDAVVAEGTEAGGHNGREGLTSMVLWPSVADAIKIPFIAAGGVGDGRAMAAAFALGARGVQIGTRFAVTQESTAHENYKQACLSANGGTAKIYNTAYMPIRALSNPYVEQFIEMERAGKSLEELMKLRGKWRTKDGILDGDTTKGELVAGQVCEMLKDIPTVSEVMTRLIDGFKTKIQEVFYPEF